MWRVSEFNVRLALSQVRKGSGGDIYSVSHLHGVRLFLFAQLISKQQLVLLCV